jgi:Ca2+-binding RTX toxin-like protein
VSGGSGPDQVAGGPGDDLVFGGPGDDFLAGDIPPGPPPPPGTPLPAGFDKCFGAAGTDTAVDCERTFGIP